MSSPRDLIAASSPSYPGLMLGHADEILQRLKDAGYVVADTKAGATVGKVALAAHDAFFELESYDGKGELIPVTRRDVWVHTARAALAALGEPEAKALCNECGTYPSSFTHFSHTRAKETTNG